MIISVLIWFGSLLENTGKAVVDMAAALVSVLQECQCSPSTLSRGLEVCRFHLCAAGAAVARPWLLLLLLRCCCCCCCVVVAAAAAAAAAVVVVVVVVVVASALFLLLYVDAALVFQVCGHIVTKYGHAPPGWAVVPGSSVTIGEAGHPVPDDASVRLRQHIL